MYRRLLIVAGGGIAAFVLHVTVGWIWTTAAGGAVGLASDRSGWWYGGWAVLADWAVLVAWNFAVAAEPTLRAAETMGALMGNMPGWMFVGVTLFVGFAVGAVGGLMGYRLRRLGSDLFVPAPDLEDERR